MAYLLRCFRMCGSFYALVFRMARHASFYELKYNRKLFILTSKLVQFNEQFICTLCCEQRPFLAVTSVLLFVISSSTETLPTLESFLQDRMVDNGKY